ncbi:MAG: LOG family protein [Gemmatimonadota bacterium]|nr:LOG family protein [Gemmatimonadota bacterium]
MAETRKRPAEGEISVGEDVFEVVEDALYDIWSVANELARIRPPKPRYYRVTIFGSSRIRPGDEIYDEVRQLARELSEMGCDIVTGGGPGLMQAANEGAKLGDPENLTRSFGLPIQLPMREEEPNPFVEKIYHHRTFFSRLHHFVRLSSAFIVVRGGIGTTLETALIWQLLQVNHVTDVPLILIGDMWKDLQVWAKRHMLKEEPDLASPADLDIPHCVGSVSEACALIAESLEAFNEGGPEAEAED